MKIVKMSNTNVFRFECPKCGSTLEANGKEFEFVRPGRLSCTCAKCSKTIEIKERHIEIIRVYEEIKKS